MHGAGSQDPLAGGRVAVLGSANMDLVVRQPRWAGPGETIHGTDFSTGAGGKGLNQAVAAARAGAEVAFLGAVGRDEFGARLRESLEREGIDTSGLRELEMPTGVAVIGVSDEGENSIVIVAGANGEQTLTEADRATIRGSRFLVAQLERPIELVAEALSWAREHGVTTVLTPAPATDGLEHLVSLADVLIPNEGEAMVLAGASDAAAAAAVLARSAGVVVVTLGARGVLVATGGSVRHIEAPRVEPVDTTGAGDTFAGALVAWLASGESLERALEAAIAAAAISVTRPGAAASVPARTEILEMLAGRAPL